MNVPDWYELLVLALAGFRTFRLLAEDTILEPPRARVMRWLREEEGGGRYSDFLVCPWCLGFWVGLGIWGAWQWKPEETLIACIPFALSALIALIAIWGDP